MLNYGPASIDGYLMGIGYCLTQEVLNTGVFLLCFSIIILSLFSEPCIAASTQDAKKSNSNSAAIDALPLKQSGTLDSAKIGEAVLPNSTAQGSDEEPISEPGYSNELPKAPVPQEAKWLRSSNLNSIYFEYGSAKLTDSAMEWIKHHAEKLLANPKLMVTLYGYTDDYSSSSYSVALSTLRTQVVRDQLVSLKVPPNQIRVISYAYEKYPTVPCQTDMCRSSYRRVEVRYTVSKSDR